VYAPPNFAVVYYLGFDPKGTLDLDGIDCGSSFLFDSFKGTTFKNVVLEHSIGGPGSVLKRSATTSWSATKPTARTPPIPFRSAEIKANW
jgi:hypothetical protein